MNMGGLRSVLQRGGEGTKRFAKKVGGFVEENPGVPQAVAGAGLGLGALAGLSGGGDEEGPTAGVDHETNVRYVSLPKEDGGRQVLFEGGGEIPPEEFDGLWQSVKSMEAGEGGPGLGTALAGLGALALGATPVGRKALGAAMGGVKRGAQGANRMGRSLRDAVNGAGGVGGVYRNAKSKRFGMRGNEV
jgi:hypothetical protein